MDRRTIRAVGYSTICWRCLLKQTRLSFGAARRRHQGFRTLSTSTIQRQSAVTVHHDSEVIEPAVKVPIKGRIPIRQRLTKWEEQNPQTYQQSLPGFKEGEDPLTLLSRLLRKPTGSNARQAETLEEEIRDGEYGTQRAVGHDGDTSVFIDELEPGDLIDHLGALAIGHPAIFVRPIGRKLAQAITLSGRWVTFPIVNTAARMVPRFVDPTLVAPLLPYLPSEAESEEVMAMHKETDIDIPREVTAPLVRAMKEFWNATQTAYRRHASTLDKAHEMLAHEKDLRFGSLEKITRKLLPDDNEALAPPVLNAVRRALLEDTSGFNFDPRSHGRTQMFQIRSKEQTEALRQVRSWIRDFQEVESASDSKKIAKQQVGWKIIRDFVDKSRKLIRISRKERPGYEHGIIGPSNTKIPISAQNGTLSFRSHGRFDDNERLIIRFLEAWSIHKAFVRDYAFAGLPPTLLRAAGMYDDLDALDRSTGYVFLQEIGVLEPYANSTLYDINLLLPSSQHSRPLQQLETTLQRLQPNDIKLPDRMASVRRQWTNLNVFCIDDPGTSEVDDGISVERVPGSPTEHWLHVHVANPTAFIERDSIFARMAAHLTETFYSPEKNFYLLPHWMSTDLFSLAPDRPCITFSARLNEKGQILEARVQPAIVHKVRQLTYNHINELMGCHIEDKAETLTVGGEVASPPQRPLPKLDEAEMDDLRLLHKLALSRKQFRLIKGLPVYERPEVSVKVLYKSGIHGLPDAYPHRAFGTQVIGDPILQLTVQPFENWFGDFTENERSISQLIVREAMIAACETAGRWSADRNIPILFRGANDEPMRDDRVKYENEVLRPAMAANGGIAPMWAALQYVNYFAMGSVGAKPMTHASIGLDHYSKVTSPLRRYGDMLTHWQIEAALRLEAETGKSLIGETHHLSKLPFSEAQIDAVARRLHPREKLIRIGQEESESFWLTMFMMRSHFYNELPPEKQKWKFNVMVEDLGSRHVTTKFGFGIHMDWGLRVLITHTPNLWKVGAAGAEPGGGALDAAKKGNGWEPEVGDVWEAEMTDCDVYWRYTAVQLTKLVSRRAI